MSPPENRRPSSDRPVTQGSRDVRNGGATQKPASSQPPETDPLDLWGEDFEQRDELLPVAADQRKGTPVDDEPYDFTVACLLCGTRLEARSEQVGGKMQCPDCHSHFIVNAPAAKARRPRLQTADPDDGELRLSELPPSPVKSAHIRDILEQIPTQPDRVAVPAAPMRSRILTPDEVARDTFARAQEEAEEEKEVEPPLPANPMTTGVLRFLGHPSMIVRVLAMAAGFWLEFGTIQTASQLTDEGMLQQFGSVILRPIALVCGLLLAANFSTALLAITHDSSLGKDEMKSLPGANPVEWFFEGWPMFVSLFLSLVLPGILAQGVYFASGSPLSALLTGGIPAVVLLGTVFPVMLLSFLENGTPFSPAIWRGLRLAGVYWGTFAVQGGVLAGIGLALIAARWASSSSILNFLLCVGLTLAALLYFRLLGRLTWLGQIKVADELAAKEAA